MASHIRSKHASLQFQLFLLLLVGVLPFAAQAQDGLVKISSDPFTNSTSQHATEVEPDTYAFGSTFVSAFQVGRIYDGGGADLGFATSTNGGGRPGRTVFCRELRPSIKAEHSLRSAIPRSPTMPSTASGSLPELLLPTELA